MARGRLLIAAAIALFAFALYRSTLLPGLDLGDTASFQTTVSSPVITPRDGYPLYFAIGKLFLRTIAGDPAHALNLASAVEAALACAVVFLIAVEISGAIGPAVAASLLFAGSYTFWSQAVIAEVYSLHLLLVALTLLLLLRWEERPTTARLAALFAVYAAAFGNHLSMILLAPAIVVFLLTTAPRGWRSMFSPRVIALALACACAGALQYAWNLRGLWLAPQPPDGLMDAVQRFWFDVTKVDWRETMVMQVHRSAASDRLAMYAFDLRQQFGWIGPVVALGGLIQLALANWRRALVLFLVLAANVVFAFGYNVGDAHVFYLPSHLIVALLVASGVVMLGALIRQPWIASLVLIAYAAARIYHAYPALDRSEDSRPADVLTELTAGLDDRHEILLTDLNWQLENGLLYFAKETRREVAHARMSDVILYAPALVSDNVDIERNVVVTDSARRMLTAAYGPLLATAEDPTAATPRLSETIRSLAPGTRYVLAVLKPTRDVTLDEQDLGRALEALGVGPRAAFPAADYVAVAGVVGKPPLMIAESNRPFRRTIDVDGVSLDVRMESWLAADTIRRMGFGHAIAARHHTLIIERGISFAAFDASGRALRLAYAANVFEPLRRYLINMSKEKGRG